MKRARATSSKAKVVGGTVPKEFIPGVEKGLNSVMGSGILAGFPVVDVKIALTDGAYHEVDSSAIAFEIAARMALREGLQKAGAILLEPIMKVEVTSPEDYLGGVIGDLNSRRGQILGTVSARQRANRQCHGAAGQHVWLCQQPALDEPGTRQLHHAVRPL